MTTQHFFILKNGKFLKVDDTFSDNLNIKSFSTEAAAVNHIDTTLSVGEYSIISKVIKT